MECDICLLEWDSSQKIPRLLSCGHTFCQVCLQSILSKAQSLSKKFTCPTCHTSQEISTVDDINKLIKNYNLLRIAEKIEIRKTIIASTNQNNSRIADSFLDVLDEMENNTISNVPNIKSSGFLKEFNKSKEQEQASELNKMNFNFDLEQKCKKHGLPIHSYAIGTNLLFCDSCIVESNLKTYPLPNVISEIRRKIDQNQIKACLTKNEIQRLQVFFELYLAEFEKANTAKIENLFNYFYKIIKYYHNSAKQMLNQCLSEQKTQLNQRITELKDLGEELTTMESDLTGLNNSSEGDLLKGLEKIRKIQHRLKNYINYSLEFDLLLMKIGINNEAKDNLLTAIQEAYHIDVEFLQIHNERPSIKEILKVNNHWSCICGELNNSLDDVKCASCNLFRRFETIPDFYSNPNNVSSSDMKIFNLRKKEEAKEFQSIVKQNSSQGKYYAIAIEWYLQWKCYITNDQSDKYLPAAKKKMSVNKLIGILPPGPITNSYLLESVDKGNNIKELVLKKELKKNDHYIIISDLVWNFFFLNYNGGPAIVLNGLDSIYTCYIKTNGSDYQSYSSIKDEFIDEPIEKKISNSELDFSHENNDNNDNDNCNEEGEDEESIINNEC